jgi:hypothetical protein
MWLNDPFTDGQAWVDLLMLANHREGVIKVRGIRITVGIGQVGWSEKRLSERWKWSRGKVRRFVQFLVQQNMIEVVQQKNKITTIISICKYSNYQGGDTTNGTTNDTTDDTTDGQQTDTNKNGKKEKNLKKKRKEPPLPPQGGDVPPQKIIDHFNSICKNLPRVQSLNDTRKKTISARLREYGQERIIEIFRIANDSDFLSGRDGKGFVAGFDWIMGPKNFVKVMEGNYNNRPALPQREDKMARALRIMNETLQAHEHIS